MYQVLLKINRPNLPPLYKEVQSHLPLCQAQKLASKINKKNMVAVVTKNKREKN